MIIGKYKTYSYSIITQTIFPRNSTQGIVRSRVIAKVSAPVKMAPVNIKISNYGHQLPEQLIYSGFYLSYCRTPSHSSLDWLGVRYRTPRPESRDPVPDAETLGLRVRYRTPRHFLDENFRKDNLMGAAYKSTYKSAAKNSMVLTCSKYMLQYLSIHFVPGLVV